MTHLVCVDAYEGAMEPLGTSGPRPEAEGLGLPWPELSERLDATVTLLDWSAWYAYESGWGSIADWEMFPLTRAVERWPSATGFPQGEIGGTRRRSIEVVDPDDGQPLEGRLPSPRCRGMLAEGDPLFLLSVILHRSLVRLHNELPIDVILLPMFGGLGYVPQLERSTTGTWASTAFGVVVTSDSATRIRANEEGEWSRPAIARRQREELSLALADVALAFGPRGVARARRGRLSGGTPAELAPRRGACRLSLSSREPIRGSPRFVSRLPCDGASGTSALLHAARLMKGTSLSITCAGPDRVFAPMAPRSFRQYWSGRAWVAELTEAGRWMWEGDVPPATAEPSVEVLAGRFSHLDDIGRSLAGGDVVVLSQDVADGLGLVYPVPEALLVRGEPDAEEVARCLSHIATLPPGELEALRLAQCEAVDRSGRGAEWEARLDGTAAALRGLAGVRSRNAPSLSRVLQRQRDPRVALVDVATVPPVAETSSAPPTLTAVVTSYGMGALARQTVESIWASTRRPDELIIIDDGSRDRATQGALEAIRAEATQRGLPLRVIRQENQGLPSARNAALAAATGTFISFIDGDDLVEPAFYELAVSLLDREPGVGAVSAWAELFGDGTPDGFWNAPQPELPLLLIENQVIVPAVTRTALLRSLGGYDTVQTYNYEDWELSVRYLARGHPIVTIPRYLHRYRVRAESMYRSMNPAQHVLMRERFLATHRDVAASFALEVALQLEHRLWQRIQADVAREGASEDPSPGIADGLVAAVVSREGRLPLMRRARQAVLRTVNSLRKAMEL